MQNKVKLAYNGYTYSKIWDDNLTDKNSKVYEAFYPADILGPWCYCISTEIPTEVTELFMEYQKKLWGVNKLTYIIENLKKDSVSPRPLNPNGWISIQIEEKLRGSNIDYVGRASDWQCFYTLTRSGFQLNYFHVQMHPEYISSSKYTTNEKALAMTHEILHSLYHHSDVGIMQEQINPTFDLTEKDIELFQSDVKISEFVV